MNVDQLCQLLEAFSDVPTPFSFGKEKVGKRSEGEKFVGKNQKQA